MRWLYRILFWTLVSLILYRHLKENFVISILVLFVLYYLNRICMREVLGRRRYFLYGLLFTIFLGIGIVVNLNLIEDPEFQPSYTILIPNGIKLILIPWIVLVFSFQATITKDWFDGFSIADGFKFKLKRMRYEKSKTELELLKTQLSPHLYKNLLTNIYDLVINNNRSAPDAIVNLKELMEYMLYDTNGKDKVELYKEIEFITKLIEIRKNGLDYPNQISFHVNVPDEIKNKVVMPFTLLPFIENLFTHCNFNSNNAFARIELNYDSDGILHFFVQNSYSEIDKKKNKGGLGIPTLEQRLNRFYKKKYALTNNGKNGIFTSKLELKLL